METLLGGILFMLFIAAHALALFVLHPLKLGRAPRIAARDSSQRRAVPTLDVAREVLGDSQATDDRRHAGREKAQASA